MSDLNSNSASPTDILGGGSGVDATILGCPISSFLAIQSACPINNAPACVSSTESTYGSMCCSSLYSFGLSLGSCYENHAPACLDTTAAVDSLTGALTGTGVNPCPGFVTDSPKTAKTTEISAKTTGTTTGTSTSGTSTETNQASATAKGSGKKLQAGLKIYIGVVLVTAFAVLKM